MGTWSYNVGIAVYAYQKTGSTAWVAAATVGRYVPALLLTYFGSRWVQRFPRTRVAVTADFACAATMVVLTLLTAARGPLLGAIALAALSSGLARIQSAAAMAVAGDLVLESRLVRSMAVLSTSEAVATAVGPAIASLILAFADPQVLFLLNGLTFAVSGALLAGLRTRAMAVSSPTPEPDLDRQVVRAVWPLLAVRTIAAAVYGADVVLLAVLATHQLGGTGTYGSLLAAAGCGGLLAAVVAQRFEARRGVLAPAVLGMALAVLPLLAFVPSPGLTGSLGTQAVRGFGCVVLTTSVVAGLQRAVPSALAGPVFGLTHAWVLVGTIAGSLFAPLSLHAVGLHATLLVFGTVPFLLFLAVAPSLARFDAGAESLGATLDPRVELLRRLALFRDTSRWTLSELATKAQEMRVATGADVVRQGEGSDALYVLVEGRVGVSAEGPSGRTPLRTLSAPDYFGEIGLIHGIARTATVTAEENCTLWRLDADAFLSVAAQAGLSSALSEGVRVRLETSSAVLGSSTA